MDKSRSVVKAIILSLITCGLYQLYWHIVIVDELNEVSHKDNAHSGIMVFLLSIITCGIYWFIWLYKAGERIDV